LLFALKFIGEKYFDKCMEIKGEKKAEACVRKGRTKIKDRIQIRNKIKR
jgi:hypothetical protein